MLLKGLESRRLLIIKSSEIPADFLINQYLVGELEAGQATTYLGF